MHNREHRIIFRRAEADRQPLKRVADFLRRRAACAMPGYGKRAGSAKLRSDRNLVVRL